MELTDRQKREAIFFDEEYSESYLDFNEEELRQNLLIDVNQKMKEYADRYKYAYELIGDITESKVLDLGCGSGQSSVILAKKGAQVNAFDISKTAIEIAIKRAKINSVQDKIKFEVGSAEKMRYDSNSFDLVFGVGLLHHVNIAVAAPEIYRVLKDGGQAVFMDPIVFSNILDKIRHSASVTYFVPDEGVEVLITEDEHQINIQEYSILDKTFNTCDYKSFRLLSRLDRIICGYPVDENNIIVRFLNFLDRFLLNNFTFLKKFGGWGVISVRK
jgi:2-polyprenyl-3-methyl-5-hydroxy-6-metoxy-1,4-benzoquinol methylase